MAGIFSRLQQAFFDYVTQHHFNTALKIRHVGTRKRLQPMGRLAGYAAVGQALVRYPLPQHEARLLLQPMTHPHALKTWAEVESSLHNALALGLPVHKGREKNWDFLAAFSTIMQRNQPEDVVIDLGTGHSSVVLEWLHLYGYDHLYGCDLLVEDHQMGHIQYTRQNLEHTNYPDQMADVVTCLSVIEHGVNIDGFMAECARLLKPGGLLLLSTDYWCEVRDLSGVHDELGQVYVFAPQTMQALMTSAQQHGLAPIGTPDYACGDPVVQRPNVPQLHQQYTFYYAAFQKM
jgi:SAM-dependent methyltransferase